jgi:hypothetical protein
MLGAFIAIVAGVATNSHDTYSTAARLEAAKGYEKETDRNTAGLPQSNEIDVDQAYRIDRMKDDGNVLKLIPLFGKERKVDCVTRQKAGKGKWKH